MLAVFLWALLTLLSFSECAARGGFHHGRDLRFIAQNTAILPTAIFNDDVPGVKRAIQCECQDVLEAPQFLARSSGALGGTSLHLAVELQNLPMVKLLVNAGANINARSPSLATPLHVAAVTSVPILSYLLKKGAGLSVQDSLGDTPLHYAVINSNLEATKILLKAGADPNIRDDGFFTPLHEAAFAGGEKIVKILIEAGADPKAVSTDGLTPLQSVCLCVNNFSCKVNQCNNKDARRTKNALKTKQKSAPAGDQKTSKTKTANPKKKPKKSKTELTKDKQPKAPPRADPEKNAGPLSPLERLRNKLEQSDED
ncbi:hypothetical protein BSKO_07916 [Bryopsis sp. KO-2023]|nr:hypothetical protein BSKO_07916 [Bryopsis sp. KO-2023]